MDQRRGQSRPVIAVRYHQSVKESEEEHSVYIRIEVGHHSLGLRLSKNSVQVAVVARADVLHIESQFLQECRTPMRHEREQYRGEIALILVQDQRPLDQISYLFHSCPRMLRNLPRHCFESGETFRQHGFEQVFLDLRRIL